MITDEDFLTDRQIEFWIKTQRELWIKRRDDAYTANDESLSQQIISDVKSVDRSVNGKKVVAQYRVLRTSDPIPKPIAFKSWDGIISTGPIDLYSNRFNHVAYGESLYANYGRFNKAMLFTYYLGGYVYIVSRSNDNYFSLLTKIAIRGIFNDPREVGKFNNVDGSPCWSESSDDYPINDDLWNYMKSEILNGNYRALYSTPVDMANDDNISKNDRP